MKRHSLLTHSLSIVCVTFLLFSGCGKKDAADYSASDATADAENPYAKLAGTWMTDVMTGDSDEPATSVLLKSDGTKDGWTMKFSHLDEAVMINNTFLKGDTVVSQSGPYLSALREGRTVEDLVSYMYYNGDEATGRFTATYDDGVTSNGMLHGVRQ